VAGVGRQGLVAGGLCGLVLVSGGSADPLVAARAEGVAAVAGGGAVAGEDDRGDVGRAAGVVEGPVELVDGVGAEGVADGGPVEGDPHHRKVLPGIGAVVGAAGDEPVVGDVGQGLAGQVDVAPAVGIEGV